MTDGERKARLLGRPDRVSGVGLNITLTRGGEDPVVEVAELVRASAHGDAELVDEELLLQVGPDLVPVLGSRGERDVEVVAPVVSP